MALQQKKKTIGVHTYTHTQLLAGQGRKVLTRLLKLLAGSTTSGGSVNLAGIASMLNDDDLDFLCDVFAEQTIVSGGPYKSAQPLKQVFQTHFSGNYGEMINWLKFCVEANFSTFFTELPGMSEGLEDKST